MLDFELETAHISGSISTAADFFSRLELKVTEKIRLALLEVIQTTPDEVTTSFWDVADKEKFFFTKEVNKSGTEEQTVKRKNQSRKNEAEWLSKREPSSPRPVPRKLQTLTETVRPTPSMESKQVQAYEWSKTLI